MCPVGRTLGLSADIVTHPNGGLRPGDESVPASYANDLGELPIPYVDAD